MLLKYVRKGVFVMQQNKYEKRCKWCDLSFVADNIMSLFIELYPQNRVKHLVRYGSSKRIRNKNASRILKEIHKEMKQAKDYRYLSIDIASKLK